MPSTFTLFFVFFFLSLSDGKVKQFWMVFFEQTFRTSRRAGGKSMVNCLSVMWDHDRPFITTLIFKYSLTKNHATAVFRHQLLQVKSIHLQNQTRSSLPLVVALKPSLVYPLLMEGKTTLKYAPCGLFYFCLSGKTNCSRLNVTCRDVKSPASLCSEQLWIQWSTSFYH